MVVDLFIIGGGVNGSGIARDAAGRGLSVTLAEKGDLGGATSSASTKLFHGGLRYLEFFEIGLVKSALRERETLLNAMPHISWPLRFVLPYNADMRFDTDTPVSKLIPFLKGRRPAWMIRAGLFAYDHLGGRNILPGTATLDLREDEAGQALQDRFQKGFEYSDVWVEDSRLVILNARDAEARGARILTRCGVVSAERVGDLWEIRTEDRVVHKARMLVNAGGPWVEDIIKNVTRRNTSAGVRLVRGSHIVTKRLFDHDRAYFLQGEDGRIIFAIPYEQDFTLIGTTDAEHTSADVPPECTPEEAAYLCEFASKYFEQPVTKDDIVWTYSGVRPLYDDGAKSATAATRDYVLDLDTEGPPVLAVFGGKITTYRKLSEQVMTKLMPDTNAWTAGAPLPGGDFAVADVIKKNEELMKDYPFLTKSWAARLIRAYGTDAWQVLGDAKVVFELGENFGATLTQAEVDWLRTYEYARTAEDILWRRSKLGLRLHPDQQARLKEVMGA